MPKTKLIYDVTRSRSVCVGELADGPLLRMRGLLGRASLPAGQGLLLTPAPAIHTAFMRFPIDALFLDSELRVLGIVRRLDPWRVASQRKARSVLELRAGETERLGVAVGDVLELRESEPIEASSRLGALKAAIRQQSRQDRAGAATTRVLVISPDHRYREVMSLLLARRGFAVSTGAHERDLDRRTALEPPHVVVLECDGAEAPELAFAPGGAPAVVLVAEEDQGDGPGRTLAKWGPFEMLVEAIVEAALGPVAAPGDGDARD
jgi:uncharacterized membrane protein (UPF0127 family)